MNESLKLMTQHVKRDVESGGLQTKNGHVSLFSLRKTLHKDMRVSPCS